MFTYIFSNILNHIHRELQSWFRKNGMIRIESNESKYLYRNVFIDLKGASIILIVLLAFNSCNCSHNKLYTFIFALRSHFETYLWSLISCSALRWWYARSLGVNDCITLLCCFCSSLVQSLPFTPLTTPASACQRAYKKWRFIYRIILSGTVHFSSIVLTVLVIMLHEYSVLPITLLSTSLFRSSAWCCWRIHGNSFIVQFFPKLSVTRWVDSSAPMAPTMPKITPRIFSSIFEASILHKMFI